MAQLKTNNIPNSQRHQSQPPKLWFSSILQTQLCLKDGAKPQFWRLRLVPLAIRDVIGLEPDHLEKEGVLLSPAL